MLQGFEPGQLGKMLILAGLVLLAAGVLVIVLGRAGLFRLPGDLEFGDRNWRVFIPLASCIVISLILTAIMWLVNFFNRK